MHDAPRDVESLCALVAWHSARGERLRAVGSETSLADLRLTDGAIVPTDGLVGELPLPALAPGWDPAGLVRVASGTRVRAVQQLLARTGRMLENTPAFTGQSIAGAVSTASHGTGARFGSLADLVVSVDLVLDGGTLLRIEGADGPTDPARFRGPLVQDDRWFRAVVVGLGGFGIQASCILRVTPLEHLLERRFVVPLDEALDHLLHSEARHVGLLLNPYPDADGVHQACVTERTSSQAATGWDRLQPRQRPWPIVFSRLPLERPLLAWAAGAPETRVPWMLGSALRSTERPRFVGPAPQVLDNYPLNQCASAYAIESSLPRAAARPVLAEVLDLAAREAAAGRFLSGPIALRTVAASEHHLAPTWRQDSVVFECVGLRAGPWGREVLQPHAELLDARGGRPHLGLDVLVTRTRADLERQFPAFRIWAEVLAEVDPAGRFDNPTFDRLAIRRARERLWAVS